MACRRRFAYKLVQILRPYEYCSILNITPKIDLMLLCVLELYLKNSLIKLFVYILLNDNRLCFPPWCNSYLMLFRVVVTCRIWYSIVSYFYISCIGSITSVGEERAYLSAIVYL